jgi:hypothetical protein
VKILVVGKAPLKRGAFLVVTFSLLVLVLALLHGLQNDTFLDRPVGTSVYLNSDSIDISASDALRVGAYRYHAVVICSINYGKK